MKKLYLLLLGFICLCFVATSCVPHHEEENVYVINQGIINCNIITKGNYLNALITSEKATTNIACSFILDNQEIFTTDSFPCKYETTIEKGAHTVGLRTSNNFTTESDGKIILSGVISTSTTVTISIP